MPGKPSLLRKGKLVCELEGEKGWEILMLFCVLDSESYVLREWPAHYRMFDHQKGKQDNPRHDAYLFGMFSLSCTMYYLITLYTGAKSKFRSVPEFIPHAMWLTSDPALGAKCTCKYCTSSKLQRVITQTLQDQKIIAAPASSTPRLNRHKPIRGAGIVPRPLKPREPKLVFAGVRQTPKVNKHLLTSMRTVAVVRERESDLRAINSPKTKTTMFQRLFREGEVLWCALNPPILDTTSGDGTKIEFWPGIVENTALKTNAFPRAPASSSASQQPSGSNAEARDDEPPWTVRQGTTYKVKLLGIGRRANFDDDQVLPYQAYILPDSLLFVMSEILYSQQPNMDPEAMADFDPTAPVTPESDRFLLNVQPYTVAISIASKLTQYWCVTDPWDFKHVPGQENNLGSSSGQTVTETRFQGLWWGAERIWIDELVRLKPQRSHIAPVGALNVFPPAGPSAKTAELFKASLAQISKENEMNGIDVTDAIDTNTSLGAETRGVFMRLGSITVVDVPGSAKKECRANGMLYELVDEDWEENQVASLNGTADTGNSANGNAVAGPSQANSASPSSTTQNTELNKPPLPLPPKGFKFRSFLTPGYEATVSLTLISGRYYPDLLSHPMLQDQLSTVFSNKDNLTPGNNLFALEGLSPGLYNSVDPVKHCPDRVSMLRAADETGREHILNHRKQEEETEENLEEDDSMVVDG